MSEIQFRKALAADLQLLVDARVAFLSEYWGTQPQSSEAELRAELRLFFEREISAGTYSAFLAFDEDRLVGTGGMKYMTRPGSFRVPDGRCAYIMNMHVLPAYRRRGIAKKILDLLIEEGKNAGIRFFELHATEEGEPLYADYGFKKHGEPTYRLLLGLD